MSGGRHVDPLLIDGSLGEGGGQILRSALALSLVTGRPFRIERIRHNRRKPGLMRQHLTAVQAAARIGCAEIEGASVGSSELCFTPAALEPGEYHFAIGTAGSTALVLQAVLPALLVARGPSRVVIEGGTHNPNAPPFEFLARAFLPLLARMGAKVDIQLERHGFYPAGGGRIAVDVQPVGPAGLGVLHLHERGAAVRREAVAMVANLSRDIAKRELKVIGRKFDFAENELRIQPITDSQGPGNLLSVAFEFEHVTEVFTGAGEAGKPAEHVAGDVVHEARAYLASDAPVGRHLADQLLLPMAMAGAGSFRALPLSRHARTNIEIVERFLPVVLQHRQEGRVAVVEVVRR
ncbi:MAG: RNA 3'-terminal phosphate cyclase [Planctomycetes bacterium]|nr:RNA 3'-terminal phosphate cyclase [Planctomycetota bacterium]MCB9871259.1 RNA 3'-terminal phosphate cyclase [Planctomycetota bacterium]